MRAQSLRVPGATLYYEVHGSGVDAAMRFFSAGAGLGQDMQPPEGVRLPQHLMETISRIRRNLASWMESELFTYPRFVPDLTALTPAADRLVLAGGRDSRDHFPCWPNTVLAERLGGEVVDFPGGHIGYLTHPAEFAARLHEVLA